MDAPGAVRYGDTVGWTPAPPRYRPLHLLLFWLIAAAAVLIAGAIVPGVTVHTFGEALLAALLIAALNALLAPIVAALRLPFTLALGFLLVLVLDALILLLASSIDLRDPRRLVWLGTAGGAGDLGVDASCSRRSSVPTMTTPIRCA